MALELMKEMVIMLTLRNKTDRLLRYLPI